MDPDILIGPIRSNYVCSYPFKPKHKKKSLPPEALFVLILLAINRQILG